MASRSAFCNTDGEVLKKVNPRIGGRVKNGRYVVQTGTPNSFGHLTMAHPELWACHVAEFMHELGD
jgi:hypothetical protein